MNKTNYRVIACWILVIVFWGLSWSLDWMAALAALFGNMYILLAVWFGMKAYEREQE